MLTAGYTMSGVACRSEDRDARLNRCRTSLVSLILNP